MKFVIQKVSKASVTISGNCVGRIQTGLVVFIGIGKEDTREIADQYIKKMINLRIFTDEEGKTNLSLADVNGSLLLISQFTLYADCRKGNRPSFFRAQEPDAAKELYNYIIQKTKESVPDVQTGEFGALMEVSLVNEGPFTIVLDEAVFGF